MKISNKYPLRQKNKLTPEQLTEKFFTEVLGWTWFVKQPPHTWSVNDKVIAWRSREGEEQHRGLEPLHKSLDLQEIWLWPELLKIKINRIEFTAQCNGWVKCEIIELMEDGELVTTQEETCKGKALAQLTATLKALGVEI